MVFKIYSRQLMNTRVVFFDYFSEYFQQFIIAFIFQEIHPKSESHSFFYRNEIQLKINNLLTSSVKCVAVKTIVKIPKTWCIL